MPIFQSPTNWATAVYLNDIFMRSRIKTSSTLVYSGKKLEVKKSTTETLISRWYEMSDAETHKEKLQDAWAMYKEFQLKTAMKAVERGIYA